MKRMVAEYHLVGGRLPAYDRAATQRELLWRLHFELFARLLTPADLHSHDWLRADLRDDNHHCWMRKLVRDLLEHEDGRGADELLAAGLLDLRTAIRRERERERERAARSVEAAWRAALEEIAREQAYRSFLAALDAGRLYEDYYCFDCYSPPRFAGDVGELDVRALTARFETVYCAEYEQLFWDYERV